MADLGAKARPIAGGTDLLVNMKQGLISPQNLVSLQRIEELAGMDLSGRVLRIKACQTVSELAQSAEICSFLNALSLGASALGSPLIRNMATVGGNLVSARPAADLPPPLMAHGAKVVLKTESGERTLSLDSFFLGPGQTAMKTDEIMAEVLIEKPKASSGSGYLKLGVRRALEISIVNVASYLELDEGHKAIRSARIVLGAVAPTPMRAFSAEEILMGERPDEKLFHKAGQAASRESQPIDDLRGSADYRRDMVSVLTQRTLEMALGNALARLGAD
jgi:carbon-monoxide dehydrogenase medium subunit